LCFGEVLWDELPQGKFLGGAPANVAYHLLQLERYPVLISAVGEDDAGQALVDELEIRGLDIRGVSELSGLETGRVSVQLDSEGQAQYDIMEPAAWDRIELPLLLDNVAPRAVVFGSLALRGEHNRRVLENLLARDCGLKVFDVNLRAPYDDHERVLDLASRVDVLKLNHHELEALTGKTYPNERYDEGIRELSAMTGVTRICVTLGDKGAVYFDRGKWSECPGVKAEVKDTVGAGDSFTACMTAALVMEEPAGIWVERACRLGAYVASCSGAMPPYEIKNGRPFAV